MYPLALLQGRSEELNCCLTCDVSFAPPAAVWIALNPTQVTMSFTGHSDFHLHCPHSQPTIQTAHLSGCQCSSRLIKTHLVSRFLFRLYPINKGCLTLLETHHGGNSSSLSLHSLIHHLASLPQNLSVCPRLHHKCFMCLRLTM